MKRILLIMLLALPVLVKAQIPLIGYVSASGGGSFPVTIDTLAFGGWMSVHDTVSRDRIPGPRRKYDMAVADSATGNIWLFKGLNGDVTNGVANANWKKLIIGVASINGLSGAFYTDTTDSTNQIVVTAGHQLKLSPYISANLLQNSFIDQSVSFPAVGSVLKFGDDLSGNARWFAVPDTNIFVKSGNLSPLFTTSQTLNSSGDTLFLTFNLSNAPPHSYLGNNTGSSITPDFHQIAYTEISGTPLWGFGLTNAAGTTSIDTTQVPYGTGSAGNLPIWTSSHGLGNSNMSESGGILHISDTATYLNLGPYKALEFSSFPSADGQMKIHGDLHTRYNQAGADWSYFPGLYLQLQTFDDTAIFANDILINGLTEYTTGGVSQIVWNTTTGRVEQQSIAPYTLTASDAPTVNARNSFTQNLPITSGTDITVTNLEAGQSLILIITQDATGGHAVSFIDTIYWEEGVGYSPTNTPNGRDVVQLTATSFGLMGQVIYNVK